MLIPNTRLLAPAALTLCLSCSLSPLPAQTSAKPPVRRSATTAARKPVTAVKPASECVTLPVLSPKIPAVPAGAGCAKSLYALKFEASHIDPQVSAALRTSLEALDQAFSLNYIDTKVGTGELAQPKKWYTVNYTGYLVDGTKFDSSLDPGKEPFSFPYGGHRVIQGWDTGFEGMRAGGKRRLFVPYQLGYGDRGQPQGGIPPKAVLVFDVEFLSQSDAQPAPKTPPAPPAPAGGTTPDGTTPPPAGAGVPTAPATPVTPPAGGSKPAMPATPPPATAPPATPPPAPASPPPSR